MDRTFRFNGLAAGESFADVAHDAAGLEISPIWRFGTDIEVASTDQAEGWSVYLRRVNGEARVLHDARTMVGAARALVAADRGRTLPVSLEAWDMRCAAVSVRELPAALREDLPMRVQISYREGHEGFALAAWLDLVLHQVARRDFGVGMSLDG